MYEEIGFDVTPYINEKNAIVAKMGEQHMKLFVIPGIPEDTVFETLTRQEIKDIKWHVIADLQSKLKDDTKKNKAAWEEGKATAEGQLEATNKEVAGDVTKLKDVQTECMTKEIGRAHV